VRQVRVIVIAGFLVADLIAAPSSALGQRGSSAASPPSDTARRRVVVRPDRRREEPEEEWHRRGPLPDATPEIIASAYRDGQTQEIIDKARRARWFQDSTLTSYDATVKQRLSAGLNVKAIGRDRLLFRSEVAARVRWTRPNRAWVDVLGARTAVPVSFPGARVLTGVAELVPIPYFTGSERLMWWANFDGGEGDNDEGPFSYVHPLDEGAEAVYQYRPGESASIRLPSGREIALREVIVTAREAATDLISGSLWFESTGGQLVRAAFRPAAPMNMMKLFDEDDLPAPARALMTPYTFEVESFTIDYGLYDERWWLPRSQTARAELRVGFVRSIATIDQSFRYASVGGTDTLPSMPSGRSRFGADFGEDVERIVEGVVDGVLPGNQQFGKLERGFQCPPTDTAVNRQRRGSLRVTISMPCDTAKLAHSPELPPSIFDAGEEEFGLADARALAKELQATLPSASSGTSQRATTKLSYGWRGGLARYNRVEGLSLGLLAERPLGRGWDGSALVRLGTADLEPNVTLHATRGLERRSIAVGGYHRLDSANDWGDPFGLGGSLSSLVFGRDEGFYYRASGGEAILTRSPTPARTTTWRLFAERQHNAPVETQVSLPNATRDAQFVPNVVTVPATQGGLAVRLRGAHGLDPRGLRLSADLRAEAAAGTFDYTRVAGDFTAARALIRDAGLSLMVGAGTSGGTLSPQRSWHLGGTHTVRGFAPGTLAGDSYWLGRAELGLGGSVLKPVLFYDAGWAGSRDLWSKSRGNIRGAGGGVSFLDGLARIDLARGVDPKTVWRAHLYVEAVF